MATPPNRPPGLPTGMPPATPTGTEPGKPGEPLPKGAVPLDKLPAGNLPPLPGGKPTPGMGNIRFKEAPKMNARPYIKRAVRLLSGHKRYVATSLFVSLVIFLLPFVAAASLGPLIKLFGEAASKGDWSGVWSLKGSFVTKATGNPLTDWLATPLSFTTIFIIWASAIILRNVLDTLRAWVDANLEQRILTGLRQQIYDHVQSLSLDFFMSGQTGALMSRVLSETGAVQRLLTQVLLTPIIDVLVLLIVLSYLLILSWQMTLVLFIMAPLTLLMFRYTSGKLQTGALGINLSARELGAELEETINGISDIQVFNAQARRSERFREASKKAAKSTALTTAWMSLSNSGAQIFISMTTALILLAAIVEGRNWGLTFASAIVFMQMSPNLFTPVQRLVGSYTMYQSLVPSIVSTYELLDTKPSVVEKPDAKELGEIHGEITFRDVHFGYSKAQKVLNGLTFDIHEGETVAFVGPIGCGKSTIMNLILRFIDPQAGKILLEGQDISEVTLKSLREQVSKLSQFPFFLKGTIRENVRLGKTNATEEEIREACKLANIHDVIVDPQRIPGGYETVVDVQIPSGGQKRLIALARCLLRKPEILILDEPTENLDAEERTRLVGVISKYVKNPENRKTCLLISHDLNFVGAVADRIIVLNEGRVADIGTHEELITREGLYKQLYELKNIDPALLRTRGENGGAGAQGAPGAPVAGMSLSGMPGPMGAGGMSMPR